LDNPDLGLLSFLKRRKSVFPDRPVVRLCTCGSVPPFQLLKELIDFEETWYGNTLLEDDIDPNLLFPTTNNNMADAQTLVTLTSGYENDVM
jgi:hypothetical protein